MCVGSQKESKKLSGIKTAILKYTLAAIIIAGVIVFASQVKRKPLLAEDNTTFAKAVVTSVNGEYKIDEDTGVGDNQNVTLLIKSGPYKDRKVTCTVLTGYLYGADCKVGTKVIVRLSEYNGQITASVYNYDRENALCALVTIFLIAMWIVGGKRGINSVVALVFTFIIVLFLYIPMMYIGVSPFLAAVIAVVLITVITHILLADLKVKSISAMLGTICGVIIAGIIAYIYGKAAHVNGYNVADIETLVYIGTNSKLNIGGMLFSGILISSLGAVMDVAMSISSSLYEIKQNSPDISIKVLFRSGMNIGRDMIGTMSNTLILAYVGSSINLLMIIYAYSYPMHQVLNMYDIAIQVMEGIAGTMGIILTVPFTSLITSLLLTRLEKSNN